MWLALREKDGGVQKASEACCKVVSCLPRAFEMPLKAILKS